MKLTDEQINAIHNEYSQWKDSMYANRTLSERKDFGQFFTPPDLSIKMLEKFENNVRLAYILSFHCEYSL